MKLTTEEKEAFKRAGTVGGNKRWEGKSKTEKSAHMKMMSDKAKEARKKLSTPPSLTI